MMTSIGTERIRFSSPEEKKRARSVLALYGFSLLVEGQSKKKEDQSEMAFPNANVRDYAWMALESYESSKSDTFVTTAYGYLEQTIKDLEREIAEDIRSGSLLTLGELVTVGREIRRAVDFLKFINRKRREALHQELAARRANDNDRAAEGKAPGAADPQDPPPPGSADQPAGGQPANQGDAGDQHADPGSGHGARPDGREN